jgi:hypothetical protein
MRIAELSIKPIKPKPPMTLPQARVHGLQKNIEHDRQKLKSERDSQRKQREAERLHKRQTSTNSF